MENTNKNVEKYANWILNECDTPHDEITWLIYTILDSSNCYIVEDVMKLLFEFDNKDN